MYIYDYHCIKHGKHECISLISNKKSFICFKRKIFKEKCILKFYWKMFLCVCLYLERGSGHIGIDLTSNSHSTKLKSY